MLQWLLTRFLSALVRCRREHAAGQLLQNAAPRRRPGLLISGRLAPAAPAFPAAKPTCPAGAAPLQVSAAAAEAMLAACGTAGNRDLEPHIPALVSCIAKPAEVPDVIAKLSATTFVQVGAAANPPGAAANPLGAAASLPGSAVEPAGCHAAARQRG